jgi:hypothetical protein
MDGLDMSLQVPEGLLPLPHHLTGLKPGEGYHQIHQLLDGRFRLVLKRAERTEHKLQLTWHDEALGE